MARVPGTLDQRKIYAIRSFGLNEIIHFSHEQYNSLGKAGRGGTVRRNSIYYRNFTALQKWKSYMYDKQAFSIMAADNK